MTDATPVILIGGGGHCKSVIEAAESSGVTIAGILERDSQPDTFVLDHRIIGTDEAIPDYVHTASFTVTVGQISSPTVRRRLATAVKDAGGSFAIIVASGAIVSRYATVGAGTVVLHRALINAGASVGEHCIINSGAIIEHDAQIGDFCHISTGAIVNGQCRLGEGTFIGSGAVIRNGVSICNDCIIGAGATVISDILTPGIYVGSPARKLS